MNAENFASAGRPAGETKNSRTTGATKPVSLYGGQKSGGGPLRAGKGKIKGGADTTRKMHTHVIFTKCQSPRQPKKETGRKGAHTPGF